MLFRGLIQRLSDCCLDRRHKQIRYKGCFFAVDGLWSESPEWETHFFYHTIVDSNDVVINFIVVRRQVKKNEKISIHRAIGGCEM